MPIVVVFLIFVVCLVIAIPVSISLGIVSVLPGAFDPSFTAVSYTHLDVYKRQVVSPNVSSILLCFRLDKHRFYHTHSISKII